MAPAAGMLAYSGLTLLFMALCQGCVQYLPFTGSNLILDDLSNSTCLELQGGLSLEQPKKTFHVQSECVIGDQVELEVVLGGEHNCSRLKLVFIRVDTASCASIRKCDGKEILADADRTSCLFQCPRGPSREKIHDIVLHYGIPPPGTVMFPKWNVCGLYFNTDECVGEPCENGGTCLDGVNSYTYTCAPGFSGTHCETDVDDCDGIVCLNGGACIDGVDLYTCSCTLGFKGHHCRKIDPCVPNPCDSGSCRSNEEREGFTCLCWEGYVGATCQLRIRTERSQNQWVDLEDLRSSTCMTLLETCGPAGGALTAWINIIDCPNNAGLMGSRSSDGTGLKMFCSPWGIWYTVELNTGYYSVITDNKPTGSWFHLTILYHGLTGGMSVYHDGDLMGTDSSYHDIAGNRPPSTGHMVIGRLKTDSNGHYASVLVDELTLWGN